MPVFQKYMQMMMAFEAFVDPPLRLFSRALLCVRKPPIIHRSPRDMFHQKLSTKVNLIVFAASFLTVMIESNKMK